MHRVLHPLGLVLLGTLLMKLKRDDEAFSNMQKSGEIFDILVSSDANYRYTNLGKCPI